MAFSYRVVKYIGAYAAAMTGVDCICFTAGVGENSPLVRKTVMERLGYLGVTVDDEANGTRGKETRISGADSGVAVMVVPTNEELAIARDTAALVK